MRATDSFKLKDNRSKKEEAVAKLHLPGRYLNISTKRLPSPPPAMGACNGDQDQLKLVKSKSSFVGKPKRYENPTVSR